LVSKPSHKGFHLENTIDIKGREGTTSEKVSIKTGTWK